MSELVMTIKADKESYDSVFNEINCAIREYPEIAEEVIISIGKYLEFYPMLTGGNNAIVRVGISSKFYDFIGSIVGAKLLSVATDDSKHREFMEVSNER